jgi:shikimate dehydrogenase
MKKYLVIGNPIDHSLSPKLHNYWLKKYNINAKYEKKLLEKKDLKNIIKEIKDRKIQGINITVPFKNEIYKILIKDPNSEVSSTVENTKSVNTIYLRKDGKIFGDNTDVEGFVKSLRYIKYNPAGKVAFVLGAGGVVPSVLHALNILKIGFIFISNRTRKKAEEMSNKLIRSETVEWGEEPTRYKPDLIINCTSLGLKIDDNLNLNFEKYKPKFFFRKRLFYDVVYNPPITNFLTEAKKVGNNIENGKMMFIYQAAAAFKAWHGIQPTISSENEEVLNLLND